MNQSNAHQPTPQTKDVWEYPVTGVEPATDEQIAQWEEQVSPCEEDARRFSALLARVRQEQNRAENAYANGAMVERDYWRSVIDDERELAADAERERDDAVARAEKAEAEVARVRQEHAALLQTNGWLRDAERERDEAVDRANAAEAALSRVEKITAAERAVVRAVVEHAEASDIAPTWGHLCDAVRALRDAQAVDQ